MVHKLFNIYKTAIILNKQLSLQKKAVKQSILLLIATILSMLSLIFINYCLTRLLSPTQFGNYSLIINILSFSQVIFNFGFLQTICRLIAISPNAEECREYYSIGLVISLLLFIIMSIFLIIYAYISNSIQGYNLFFTIVLIIPFSWVYILTNFNESILQGNNDILLLSHSRLFPRIIFLIILLFIYISNKQTNLNNILIYYFISYIITYIYIIYKLKPKFKNIKLRIVEIWKANHQYGFQIYIGSIFAVGVSSLIGILISYFEKNNIPVGYYNIALQLTTPLALIPNVIATVMFKDFTLQNKINKKLIHSMILISLLVMSATILIAKPLINTIYGEQYSASIELIKYLAIGSLLYGIADFYNRFLLSKGEGEQLRNASIIVGIILLISSFILIFLWGVKGAAISKIIAGTSYIVTILFFYYKSINTKDSVL